MPLLVHAVIAWLAGLFLAALPAPRATAAVLALAVVGAWLLAGAGARRTIPALAALAFSALAFGTASRRTHDACARVLSRDTVLLVAIDERAAPGVRVTGTAAGVGAHAACRIPASLRVANGRASAGSVVRVAGRAGITARGVRIQGDVAATGRVEPLRAWRGRTGERIDRLFGRDAPLVRALLIADQDGIAPAVRDRFADAGLVHMLSISGLHVAIIAGALLGLAGALRVPRVPATVGALVAVVLYVLMLGAPAPAVRSTVMLATMAASESLQRPVHPWTALALGALVPTIDPRVVTDLGWQLSVSGMASLVAARALLRRFRHGHDVAPSAPRARRAPRALERRWHGLQRRLRALTGWRWILLREGSTGVVATLVTAPLIAWTFGRVSLIAPLSNIVAGPIVAFVQPVLFLAIVLSPWPSIASFVADASAPPLALLDRVATASATVPYASLHVAPTLFGAACAGIASAACVRATASRRLAPGVLVAAAALCLACWAPLVPGRGGALELHMIDVGQGDALALRTPRGRWVIVDAGRAWEGGDAGRRAVVPYVQRIGGPVAAFVLTHAHDDHVGGAASVVEALRPSRWWEAGFATPSLAYERALLAVRRHDVHWTRVAPGTSLRLDGVRFDVLGPDSAWTAQQSDANETSVVMHVQFGDVAFLLAGDAEREEEAWLVRSGANLRADVLKLGHHGSRTSSTTGFLDAVTPRLGLVSVGRENRYGHPSPEVLAAFGARGIPLLRTDQEGPVVVATDGRRISVRAGGDRWTLPPP